MTTLTLSTFDGDVEIREDELATITADDLKRIDISRDTLLQLFAEGTKLMQGHAASERVRPVADQTLEGKWAVHLVRFSPHNDPLMVDATEH